MSQPTSQEQILALIVRETQLTIPAEQALQMTMAKLNIDSLVLVEIVMMLEQELDIELELEFINADTTLQELINGILAAGD